MYLDLKLSVHGPDSQVLIYQGDQAQRYMTEDVLPADRSFKSLHDITTTSYPLIIPGSHALIIYQVEMRKRKLPNLLSWNKMSQSLT